MYNKINDFDAVGFQSPKWNRDLNIIVDSKTWENAFKICFFTLRNNYINWHSYKIMTRILGCNYMLHKIGISNTPLCRLCKGQPETLIHLYCLCPKSQSLWNDISQWIKNQLNILINFDNLTIILGYQNSDNRATAINTIQ